MRVTAVTVIKYGGDAPLRIVCRAFLQITFAEHGDPSKVGGSKRQSQARCTAPNYNDIGFQVFNVSNFIHVCIANY